MAARNDPRVRTASPTPSPSPSKATLFCPDCDHRSRFDGDWDVVETDRRRRYLCPECGVAVTDRPASAAVEPRGDR